MEAIDFTWTQALMTAALGVLCGLLNVLAAGGSLIAVPFLIFLGLPANVANATNRVAILMQNVVSTATYKHEKMLDFKADTFALVPLVLGAMVGATLAVDIDEKLLRRVIAIILVAMFFLMMKNPASWQNTTHKRPRIKNVWLQRVMYFFIGVYGSFIQMGVGFFLLAMMVLGQGFDLLKANAVKVMCILTFTVVALVIFVTNGLVMWRVGLTLACGNMIGAWLAVKYSMRLGSNRMRYVLLAALVIAATYLFIS